jgi:hypothetical protein
LTLNRAGYRFYQGSTGAPLPVTAGEGTSAVSFHLDTGSGMVLAAVPYEVTAALHVPPSVQAGERIQIRLTLDAVHDTIGQHVVALSVTGPDGRVVPAFSRTVPMSGAVAVELATALNDLPGDYTVRMQDLATGAVATGTFSLRRKSLPEMLPAFRLDWPSEALPSRQVSDKRFLDDLSHLAQVYATPGGDRFRLSFYQQHHGDTRYNLMMNLCAVDWRLHEGAMKRALEGGMTIILTGEDLGYNPTLRFASYVHNDGHQLEVLGRITAGTAPVVSRSRPSLHLYRIGRGRLILDRESWDEKIWGVREFTEFQRQWLRDLESLHSGGVRDEDSPVSRWFFSRQER